MEGDCVMRVPNLWIDKSCSQWGGRVQPEASGRLHTWVGQQNRLQDNRLIKIWKISYMDNNRLIKIWKILLNLCVRGITDDVGFMSDTSVFNHFYVLLFPWVKSPEMIEREKYTDVYINLIRIEKTGFHKLEITGILYMELSFPSLLFIMTEGQRNTDYKWRCHIEELNRPEHIQVNLWMQILKSIKHFGINS